jgi:hypothetical protein
MTSAGAGAKVDGVNVFVALVVVAGCAALAITAMLLVRRHAPVGSYFEDGDRAAGFFGVLATGFAVLLGLVVVLAFTTYDDSRTGAVTEALTVAQQYEVANLLPAATGRELAGELVCYGRSVVHQEWPRMERGEQTEEMNPWGAMLFRTLKRVDPRTPAEQAAYSKWLDQRFDRETARGARIHGAAGVIPTPLWLVLYATAVLISGYMLFFADSGERAFVQAAMIGSVVAVMVATLLVIRFLDNPYRPGVGSLRPVAMQRTLQLLGDRVPAPCDRTGSVAP